MAVRQNPAVSGSIRFYPCLDTEGPSSYFVIYRKQGPPTARVKYPVELVFLRRCEEENDPGLLCMCVYVWALGHVRQLYSLLLPYSVGEGGRRTVYSL